MLIILHLNLKKHHIFLDGLLLDIKQWRLSSSTSIGANENKKISINLPIALKNKVFVNIPIIYSTTIDGLLYPPRNTLSTTQTNVSTMIDNITEKDITILFFILGQ
nr:MAG: hypothetical protein [Bacteriophage sp.]